MRFQISLIGAVDESCENCQYLLSLLFWFSCESLLTLCFMFANFFCEYWLLGYSKNVYRYHTSLGVIIGPFVTSALNRILIGFRNYYPFEFVSVSLFHKSIFSAETCFESSLRTRIFVPRQCYHVKPNAR